MKIFFAQIFFALFPTLCLCDIGTVFADDENRHDETSSDAVSLLEKHLAFLEGLYEKECNEYKNPPVARYSIQLPRAYLLKNEAELLKIRIERSDSEEEKKTLKSEWVQKQREFVDAARELSADTTRSWKARTIFLNDYLDILDLTKKSEIELLRETKDVQSVQEAWENYQEELGILRGRAEELYFLRKKFPAADMLATRLALFEIRYQCASWALQHSDVPEPGEQGTETPLSPIKQYDPVEELKGRIRQCLDDQLQTSVDYVIAIKSAWNAGVRPMPLLMDALSRRNEIEIRKLRHETKPEELFDRTVEVLERNIKESEKLYEDHRRRIAVSLASEGYFRREGCHLNQLRVLITSWEIELLRLRREHTESESEKEIFLSEIRRSLDSRADLMQSVVKYVEESYRAGMCTQKYCLDIQEQSVRLELERLRER